MTVNQFRKLALALPEAVEASHMDHPDFRVGGKIFATIGPKDEWGMVKLTPEQQQSFVRTDPVRSSRSTVPGANAAARKCCSKRPMPTWSHKPSRPHGGIPPRRNS